MGFCLRRSISEYIIGSNGIVFGNLGGYGGNVFEVGGSVGKSQKHQPDASYTIRGHGGLEVFDKYTCSGNVRSFNSSVNL